MVADDREPSKEPRHPIQVVTHRTGLSPDVLRVWERRYGAVTPQRSATNRRLYSDADVERLLLLRRATAAGRRIGDVARASNESLRGIVEEDRAAAAVAGPARVSRRDRAGERDDRLAASLEAIENLDGDALQQVLSQAAVELSKPRLIDELLIPLMATIGERWSAGQLRPAHEHLGTAAVRSFLGTLHTAPAPAGAPTITVGTPLGQRHELGAMMVAVAATMDGWKVTYLGADLPAEEIAAAARIGGSKALALSVVYPPDDAQLTHDLRKLGGLIPDDLVVLVGGLSAASYDDVIGEIGARRVDDLGAFRATLQSARR